MSRSWSEHSHSFQRYAALPEQLSSARRWLAYRLVPNINPAKKPRKVPYYGNGLPRGATDTAEDAEQLCSLSEIVALYDEGSFEGLGFALGPDGTGGYWQGIDLDNVESHPGLAELVVNLPGYVERSPSGSGVHAVGYGEQFANLGSNGTGIEAYSSGRFFTVTGDRLGSGEPVSLASFVRGTLTPLRRPMAEACPPLPAVAHSAPEAGQEADLRSALAFIDPDSYEDWIRCGQALRRYPETGLALWLEWSAGSPKFNRQQAETKWRTFTADRTGPAAIFAEAQRRGWQNPGRPYWAGVEVSPSVRAFAERFAASFRPPHVAECQHRYKLLSGSEIAALPAVGWRVRGIFPAQGIGTIFGPSGSGKTFLAFDMAAHVANGTPWFGNKVKPCPVIYAALEGESGFKARVAAWEASNGRQLPEVMRLVMQPFRLTDSKDVEDLSESVLELGPGPTIFIDTLNRAAPDSDENTSKDMGTILEGAKRLQFLTGGLVILVHHTGKDITKGLRGHSSLLAAMDGAIEVARDGERRSWHVAKSKDGADGGSHQFRLAVVEVGEDDGEPVTSCVIQFDQGAAQLSRTKHPRGGNQKLALNALVPLMDAAGRGERSGQGGGIELEEAVGVVARVLTCSTDRRNERAREAITGLVSRGVFCVLDGWLWQA